jgi:hypothetical protein
MYEPEHWFQVPYSHIPSYSFEHYTEQELAAHKKWRREALLSNLSIALDRLECDIKCEKFDEASSKDEPNAYQRALQVLNQE